MSMYQSVSLCIYLYLSIYVYLYLYLSVYLTIYIIYIYIIYIYIYVYYMYQSISMSVYLAIFLSIYLSIYLYVYIICTYMCIYTYQWSKLWSVIGHDWPDFNLTKQSFPEICRNDRSLNETIWTSKCDKLHVFGMVERMERTKFVHWNIWGFRSNFVDCESFLESNSLDILALCETNL